MQDRDENLMAKLAMGERQHMECLVRRHAAPLLAFISRMVGDEHLSHDLFQEVFLAVWAKRALYKFPRPFKPWLYAIAVNKCRTQFRRRALPMISLQESNPEHASASSNPSVTDHIEASELTHQVDAIVRCLPEQQRTVLVMRVWGGVTYSGIAEAVGLREATVRSHMHHALAGVRRAIDSGLMGEHATPSEGGAG